MLSRVEKSKGERPRKLYTQVSPLRHVISAMLTASHCHIGPSLTHTHTHTLGRDGNRET